MYTLIFSQLYRSSSFNSSGRSSNCDNTEEMYSDVSLEDVQDFNNKVTQTHVDFYDRERTSIPHIRIISANLYS